MSRRIAVNDVRRPLRELSRRLAAAAARDCARRSWRSTASRAAADDIADEGDAAAADAPRGAATRYARATRRASARRSARRPGLFAATAPTRSRAHDLPLAPVPRPARRLPPGRDRARATPTTRDLLDYCRRSANPVGRLLLHLYGAADADEPARARDAICTSAAAHQLLAGRRRRLAQGARLPARRTDLARFGVDRGRRSPPAACDDALARADALRRSTRARA
ncbi:MAG: squalene/phytoene synthase family protein [Chromatiales bacterium]|nr:squalene/phytoene synthase family protein [Chromatiales bacterium]